MYYLILNAYIITDTTQSMACMNIMIIGRCGLNRKSKLRVAVQGSSKTYHSVEIHVRQAIRLL